MIVKCLIFYVIHSNIIQPLKVVEMKQIKKHEVPWIIVSFLVIAVVATAACVNASSTSNDKVLIASGHESWSPVMYHDGNGSIVGIAPEVITKALEGSEYKVSYDYVGTWDIVQEKAKTGEVDIIVALYKTDEREKYLLYTDPYILDPVGVFFTNDDLLQEPWQNFAFEQGIVTKGDSYGSEIDEFVKNGINISVAENPKEAKEMLLSGKGDYFLYSTFAGEKLFENELSDKKVYYSLAGTELFYIGVSKQNPDAEDIVDNLNKFIRENNLMI